MITLAFGLRIEEGEGLVSITKGASSGDETGHCLRYHGNGVGDK
jgi:hypothetical protein